MRSLTTLKIELEWAVTNLIAGYKVAPILIDRANQLLAHTDPYYNESIIDRDVVEQVIKTFQDNPDLGKHDMVIQNNTVYPVLMDEAGATEVITAIDDMLKIFEPNQAATIAFITKWTSQAYFQAAA